MRIADLIAKTPKFVSLEFFPPKEREAWPSFFLIARALTAVDPLFVSVTYGAGGGTQANTLEIVSRLKAELGLEPMAHLTCVGADEERIAAFLADLAKSGVDNVLALRGDPPRGAESFVPDNERFKHASDLVSFIRARQPGVGVGVAGYPEGHPDCPRIRQDLEFLKAKLDAGADFVITQLFYDNRQYFDFVERLAAMGVDKPVVPGILPIMGLASVKRILGMCGASIPGKYLLALEEADKKGGADAVRKLGVDYAKRQAQELLDNGAPGIHLYTLNKADACLEIVGALSR
ncbi:MAG: methylenetetrahydrofolate reductase [NAD(P)H] [Thermodesulfobacteriota bacterium]